MQNLNVASDIYICELLYVLGPCSAKHKRLSIRLNLANNLATSRFETYIKHFYQLRPLPDKSLTADLFFGSRAYRCDKTTRSCNDNFDAMFQMPDLGLPVFVLVMVMVVVVVSNYCGSSKL
jgi:hypothetical protein